MRKLLLWMLLLMGESIWGNGEIIKYEDNNLTFSSTYMQKFPKPDMPLGPGVRLNAVLQTPDLGYLLGGTFVQDQNDTGHRGYDAWLMRVDPYGTVQWSKVFYKGGETPYDRNEAFTKIVSLVNDGYAALSEVPFWGEKGLYHLPIIVGFSRSGNVLWKKYFYLPYYISDAQSMTIRSIVPLSDGDLLAVGQGGVRFWNDEGKYYYYVYMGIAFKVDGETGEVLFAKAYNNKIFDMPDGYSWFNWGFYSAIEKNDALYLVGSGGLAGHDANSSYPDTALLLKTDLDGNPLWGMEYYRDIENEAYNGFVGIASTPDDGLLLSYSNGYYGSYQLDINLLKVNDDGGVVSGKFFALTSHFTYLSELKKSQDGNYLFSSIVTGVTKVDKDGNPLRNLYPWAANFAVTRDNGIAAIDQDWWDNWTRLRKITRTGHCCDESCVGPGATPETIDITDQVKSVFDSSDDIYVRDLGAMRSESTIEVEKSNAVKMHRNCLTSNIQKTLPAILGMILF